jgi:hypothetical protein
MAKSAVNITAGQASTTNLVNLSHLWKDFFGMKVTLNFLNNNRIRGKT